jgi:tetratricopeptide (TPR) repeat protein
MRHTFRVLCTVAFWALLGDAPALASTQACTVPERIRISALNFSYDADLTAIDKRLKSEGFDAVAKSLPLNYAGGVGWYTPQQLVGTQYAPAASLQAGETARMNPALSPGFVHVDEIVPGMSCDRAIELAPGDAAPRLERAALEMRGGAYAAAKADYRVAAQSADSRLAQAAQYGLASIEYLERDYKSAFSSVDSAVKSNGADALTLRALIEEAMGDDDLATADANQAVNQYNGSGADPSPATFALAAAYSHLGFFSASNDELDSLLKRHPGDARALALRAFNTRAARKRLAHPGANTY